MQRERGQGRVRQGDGMRQDVRNGECQSGAKDGQRAARRETMILGVKSATNPNLG